MGTSNVMYQASFYPWLVSLHDSEVDRTAARADCLAGYISEDDQIFFEANAEILLYHPDWHVYKPLVDNYWLYMDNMFEEITDPEFGYRIGYWDFESGRAWLVNTATIAVIQPMGFPYNDESAVRWVGERNRILEQQFTYIADCGGKVSVKIYQRNER